MAEKEEKKVAKKKASPSKKQTSSKPEKVVEEVKTTEAKEELKIGDIVIPETIVPVPEEPVETQEVEQPQKTKKGKKDKKEPKRVKLKYRTKANDIKYKAPLSYRYIRMLAWFSIAIAQLGIVFKLATLLDIGGGNDFTQVFSVINFFAALPLVLFMLANFGIILRNRKNFQYLFIYYGGVMMAMYLVANLVVLHYVYGTMRTLTPGISFQEVCLTTGTFLAGAGTMGYLFNLFVDLFICVLTVFFFFYNPKSKSFEGKKILFFRALVIIPIAYEIGCMLIKEFALRGAIRVPSYLFFLLTSKPPATFAAFFIVTLILKIREIRFLKKFDHNEALLEEHYTTNAHSFRTSITISVVFAVVATLDAISLLGYVVYEWAKLGFDEESFITAFSLADAIGLGGSSSLILISPLVLLYSYTKVHKNKKLDSFLPFLGIAFMLFVVIEGVYITLRVMLPDLISQFTELASVAGEEGEGEEYFEGFEAIRRSISSLVHLSH